MQAVQYPKYLQAEGKRELADFIAKINSSSNPKTASVKVQTAVNWLVENKIAELTAEDFPELPGGKFPKDDLAIEGEWAAFLEAAYDEEMDQKAKFDAFLSFHNALQETMNVIFRSRGEEAYGAENFFPFMVSFVASRRLNSKQERAVLKVLEEPPKYYRIEDNPYSEDRSADAETRLEAIEVEDSQPEYWGRQYIGAILHGNAKRLESCLDLARAGAATPQLLDQIDAVLFLGGNSSDSYLAKMGVVLAMPSWPGDFTKAKLAKLNQLRMEYFKAVVRETEGNEQERYDLIFRCYQAFWESKVELPEYYLDVILKELGEILVKSNGVEIFSENILSVPFAKAVFSSPEFAKQQLPTIRKWTERIWDPANKINISQKLEWLLKLAQADKSKTAKTYIEEKLAAFPDRADADSFDYVPVKDQIRATLDAQSPASTHYAAVTPIYSAEVSSGAGAVDSASRKRGFLGRIRRSLGRGGKQPISSSPT